MSALIEQQHSHDDPQRQAQAMGTASTTTVGARPITFQQAKTAMESKPGDAAHTAVANNPAGVFALQQEAKKGKRAEWQAKREEFERKVAIKATKNPKVEDAVDTMVQKAVSLLIKMNADKKSQQDAIAALGGGKYADPAEATFEVVAAKLKGGSIREKMMLLGTFHETVGKQMLEDGP